MMSYVTQAILAIWILILTIIVIKQKNHYQKLLTRTKSGSIDQILESIIDKAATQEQKQTELSRQLEMLDKENQLHFKKIGLVRFNAFERTGGEQSFVLALLDSQDRGLVVNFLHTHEGIRVYAKNVVDGKGVEYDLSDEEEKAITSAKAQTKTSHF